MCKMFIYGLIDPRVGEVRYVGKAINPEERFRKHLRDKNHCHRTSWIKSLVAANLEPRLVLLEECSQEDWQAREQYWISFLREHGANLVNGTDGGDGISNPNAEIRSKIGAAHKGLHHTEETRCRISEMLKGKRNALGFKQSDETRRRMSQAAIGNQNALGYKHTEEECHKISVAQKGKPWSAARWTAEENRR